MKAALNGGLNLSVLDGWWPEAFDGSNGWAMPGDGMQDEQSQDARDATIALRPPRARGGPVLPRA